MHRPLRAHIDEAEEKALMNKHTNYILLIGVSSSVSVIISFELAQKGDFVSLVGRDNLLLKKMLNVIRSSGGSGTAIPADVGNNSSLMALTETITIETEEVNGILFFYQVPHSCFSQSPKNMLHAINTLIVSPFLIINSLVHVMPRGSSVLFIDCTEKNHVNTSLYRLIQNLMQEIIASITFEIHNKEINISMLSMHDHSETKVKTFINKVVGIMHKER